MRAVNSSSSCARLSLIQFKVLHRLHYSKAKLSRIYPDRLDDRCDRCSQAPCDLTHMFWLCPKLSSFWQSFFECISEIVGLKISPSPHVAIFGRPPDEINIKTLKPMKILLLWKSPLPPSFKMWLSDTMSLLKLEKIKFTLRGSSD
ncbi:hypothetical protein F7725_019056, partial [Dissostichus mawsoni]